MRTVVVALLVSIAVLAAYGFYVRATNPCSPGYQFNVLTARCRLVGGPVSSGAGGSQGGGLSNSGGASSGGQTAGNVGPQSGNNNCPPSSPPGCAVVLPPTNTSQGCHWAVANCVVNPDWRS